MMDSNKKGTIVTIVVIAICVCLTIVGCCVAVGEKSGASNDCDVTEISDLTVFYFQMFEIPVGQTGGFVVVDEITGVNYIVVQLSNGGVAITPRYCADGRLYLWN